MKDRFVRVVFLMTLGCCLFWCWHYLFPGPEVLIRKQLAQLAAAASIAPNETPLARLAKAQRLAELFARDAQVNVDVPGRPDQTFTGREEVQQAALGARALLNTLQVTFVDISVLLATNKNSAVTHLTATANLPGEKLPEVQELEIEFTNVDQAWLINKVQTVKTLR
jgi:hypothetical protein